ncbi:hypothetical protein FOCC_FOCC013491, partial [Frankliniella occidentalis]
MSVFSDICLLGCLEEYFLVCLSFGMDVFWDDCLLGRLPLGCLLGYLSFRCLSLSMSVFEYVCLLG